MNALTGNSLANNPCQGFKARVKLIKIVKAFNIGFKDDKRLKIVIL